MLNPTVGRFLSEDPAEDDPNQYRYVRNNPLNESDPSGLEGADVDAARRNLPDLDRMMEQLEDLVSRINEAERLRRYREYETVPGNWAAGTGAPGAVRTGRILYRPMQLQEKVWRQELEHLLVRIVQAEEQLGTTVEQVQQMGSVRAYDPTLWESINSWLETPPRRGAPDEYIGKAGGRAVRDIATGLYALATDLPGVLTNIDQTLLDFEQDPEGFVTSISEAIEARARHLGKGDVHFGYNQLIAEAAAGEILLLGAGKLTKATVMTLVRKTRMKLAAIKAVRARAALKEVSAESKVASSIDEPAATGQAPSRTARSAESVAPSGDRNWIFRGDSNYKGGAVGRTLGAEADAADIQNFADHVLRKESRHSSRYTSFTTETRVARKFPPASDSRYVNRALMERLRELEAKGQIKIWTPDEVYEALRNGPKKLRKQAADVRAAMQKNGEILIEGQIPEGILQGTN